MLLSDIRIYTPLAADAAPMHQLGCLSIYLSDVADIINHARFYVTEDAKMRTEDTDVLSSMLRGALSLLRDFGECFEAVEAMSKAWHIVAASEAEPSHRAAA